MSSSRQTTLTDLERDLPTSPADVAHLGRAWGPRPAPAFEELQRLADSLPAAARKQTRSTAEGRPELRL